MQKITPCLWFDGNGEEAMNFYTSIFKDAKIENVHRYGESGPGEAGSVLSGLFTLHGQQYMVLNGGPHFKFTPAISFSVDCKTQEEVDELWEKLSEGGETQRCGWLTDKFGVSWQIVPSILSELLHSKDREKSARAMQAMMQMVKLDIAALEQAYNG
jgi:predicted 3-demethylubiquinone-9 3-methyltransferase (glyoxalase superfamily)